MRSDTAGNNRMTPKNARMTSAAAAILIGIDRLIATNRSKRRYACERGGPPALLWTTGLYLQLGIRLVMLVESCPCIFMRDMSADHAKKPPSR